MNKFLSVPTSDTARSKYEASLVHASLKKCRGVTLVEVLITLFVFTVALAGIIKLQYVASFNNEQAASRIHAYTAVTNLSERIKRNASYSSAANGLQVSPTYFDITLQDSLNNLCSGNDRFNCVCTTRPANISNCHNQQCNQAQMAGFDLWQSYCSLLEGHPNGRMYIRCSDRDNSDAFACSPGSRVDIEAHWPTAINQSHNDSLHGSCGVNMAQGLACVGEDIIL